MRTRDFHLLVCGTGEVEGLEPEDAPPSAAAVDPAFAAAPPADDEPGSPLGLFAEPEPEAAPTVFAYPGRTTANGIPLEQILHDRPDVYAAFFREFHGSNNDAHSSAWLNRVGGATPEAYANYWYETYGKTEYVWAPPQGAPLAEGEAVRGSGRFTSDGLSIDQLLIDRPDVRTAFYEAYLGPNNDPHSSAWLNRVGGTTVEDYANYWYETYGKHGEYGPSVAAAQHAAQVGVTITDEGYALQEILADRPDVFRAFFREYYGPNNDRHSSAWVDRVGGETPEAYANFWYKTYGKAAGYLPPSLRPARAPSDPDDQGADAGAPPPPEPQVEPPPAPWGTDALGNPMPPPPGWLPDPPPSDPPLDEIPPGEGALEETLPQASLWGDDAGGLFLPRT